MRQAFILRVTGHDGAPIGNLDAKWDRAHGREYIDRMLRMPQQNELLAPPLRCPIVWH